jgi:hypothetical protein
MGLDHWLDKTYVIGKYTYDEPKVDIDIKIKGKDGINYALNVNPDNLTGITETVCVWRKENWLHKFFLEQEGIIDDNCQPFNVSEATLELLLERIDKILNAYKSGHKELATQTAMEILPPMSGFFFGQLNIDDDYFDCLVRAYRDIAHAMRTNKQFRSYFTYCASW